MRHLLVLLATTLLAGPILAQDAEQDIRANTKRFTTAIARVDRGRH